LLSKYTIFTLVRLRTSHHAQGSQFIPCVFLHFNNLGVRPPYWLYVTSI
jgi:hypothetical protein